MLQQLVQLQEGRITASSQIIAQMFEKDHKDVLKAIRNMDCSEEFSRRNFALSDFEARGKKYPMYFISKDGFMMLAMGFTGPVAAKFREAFIDAFNKMEDALKNAYPQTPVLIPIYQERILSAPSKNCPVDRFNIFEESSEIMLLIEKEVGSISQFDLVDGSIGSHWSKYRENMPWRKTVTHYYHEFKDKRGLQQCKCYDLAEIGHFRKWLRTIYKNKHLYEYLCTKFKKDKFMFPRVEAFKPKLIGKTG